MLSIPLLLLSTSPQESRGAPTETAPVGTAEPIFSGPQPGERVLPFQVLQVTGEQAAREFDPTADAGTSPQLYFFFPADVNRVIARALVNVGAIAGAGSKAGLRSYFIGLSDDLLAADQRLRDVWTSLRPPVAALLSKDGIEGPGSWGLNKKCYSTFVVVRGGRVLYNRAALSPGPGDFEELRNELSKLLGVSLDVDLDSLNAMGGGMGGRGGREGAMAGGRDEGARRPAKDAQRARVEEDLAAIAAAIERFRAVRGELPVNLDALLARGPDGAPFLPNVKALPKDPWGREYRYRPQGAKGTFEVSSLGADGAAGGEGRDADLVVKGGAASARADTPESRRSKIDADLDLLCQAVETYRMRYGGVLPESLSLLTATTRGAEPILRSLPKDPWGRDYSIEALGDARGFRIGTRGADGEPGGEGEAADVHRDGPRMEPKPASRPSSPGGR